VSGTHPPVRELIDFETVHVAIGTVSDAFLTVSGQTPWPMTVELEPDQAPSIPEPEWIRWEVVGYHYGDHRPEATPFAVTRTLPALPPGARGIEIVGKHRTEKVPMGSGD
jgi:hypothetical protein